MLCSSLLKECHYSSSTFLKSGLSDALTVSSITEDSFRLSPKRLNEVEHLKRAFSKASNSAFVADSYALWTLRAGEDNRWNVDVDSFPVLQVKLMELF